MLVFNHTVFEETKTHWTDEIIDIQMAANARAARIKTSQATNPHYEMSDLGNGFTFGESAAYVIFLGDQKGQANRTWLEFWFGEHSVLFVGAKSKETTMLTIFVRAQKKPSGCLSTSAGRDRPSCLSKTI